MRARVTYRVQVAGAEGSTIFKDLIKTFLNGGEFIRLQKIVSNAHVFIEQDL